MSAVLPGGAAAAPGTSAASSLSWRRSPSAASTSAGVAFDDRGEQSLKGVADPQRLFAVRARE
ncbi:hypothetical protein LCGC14_1945860 [marine sediment metagenome]|uniref:Uncharacterized protein n=1 Tax=marine sediment metagenome TaxID=412755 RepID=A0A0F9G790_9ZZZZ